MIFWEVIVLEANKLGLSVSSVLKDEANMTNSFKLQPQHLTFCV